MKKFKTLEERDEWLKPKLEKSIKQRTKNIQKLDGEIIKTKKNSTLLLAILVN